MRAIQGRTGYREVSWQQQALEGAGHHEPRVEKQKAVCACLLAVLSLLSPFLKSRVSVRKCAIHLN